MRQFDSSPKGQAGGDDQPATTPMSPHKPRTNVIYLADRRAPDVDDMLDRVTAEAERRDEAGEPLPYDPTEVHAARHSDEPSIGEQLHREVEQAGEDDQEPDDWEGA